MATAVVLVLCMLIAAELISSSAGQQCACGNADDTIDYRKCENEHVLLKKLEESKK